MHGGRLGLDEVIVGLSSLVRTGWMIRGVPPSIGEVVAEHSFSAALLALEVSLRLRDRGVSIDPWKATAIALVHDVGEVVVGDIAKTSGISREEKRRAEERALELLEVHDGVRSLFREFEEGASVEARVARLAESLATLLRAYYYERLGYDVSDIRDNMRRVVLELAESLGATDIVRVFVEG